MLPRFAHIRTTGAICKIFAERLNIDADGSYYHQYLVSPVGSTMEARGLGSVWVRAEDVDIQ